MNMVNKITGGSKMLLKNTKVCSKCGKEKSATEFYRNSCANDGLQTWCKNCQTKSTTNSKRYHAYLERLRYYKNKYGLSYRLLKNSFKKRYDRLSFRCLYCGNSDVI